LTASQSITCGTTAITLAGKVSAAGGVYPSSGETVTVTINGNPQATTINDATGDFSFSYNPSSIPYSASAYTITYSYAGDANLNAAPNHTSTTLTVNKATLTVTATAANKVFNDTTTAAVTLSDNRIAGDTFTTTYASATFADKNVGNGKQVTVSGIAISGGASGSYQLASTTASTASAVASSANPALPGATVSFTNTISVQAPGGGTPTGSVIFKDGATALGTVAVDGTSKAALSTSSLSHGSHTITAEYASNGNFIGSTNSLSTSQVINTAPVANLAIYTRDTNISLKILISSLITNSTSDADGDTRTLTAVGSGTNGAAITMSSKYVFYLPSGSNANSNTTDHFSYTIGDGYTTTTGTIRVSLNNGNIGPQSANLITVTTVENGKQITFVGIPGYTYRVQRTTTPNGNNTVWSDLGTCAVDGAGNGAYTDTSPPLGGAYYRTSWP